MSLKTCKTGKMYYNRKFVAFIEVDNQFEAPKENEENFTIFMGFVKKYNAPNESSQSIQ